MNTQTNQTCELFSAKQLAKMLSTSVRSVWRYRSAGRLPKTVKISGSIRWKLSDMSLFLDCNCDMQEFEARKGAEK
jgi:predicted DNA-binding transcriptional regulator AlpA